MSYAGPALTTDSPTRAYGGLCSCCKYLARNSPPSTKSLHEIPGNVVTNFTCDYFVSFDDQPWEEKRYETTREEDEMLKQLERKGKILDLQKDMDEK